MKTTDGEMLRLEQVIVLCKELIGSIELSDQDEWERIVKYIYSRFKIDLPKEKP